MLTTDHKAIGTLYLAFAILAGAIGGAISGFMRLELAYPGMQFVVNGQEWNALITAHGLIMIFLHGDAGADRRLRQLVRTDDDRRPRHGLSRANSLGFWLMPLSFVMLMGGLLTGAGLARAGASTRLCQALTDSPGRRST